MGSVVCLGCAGGGRGGGGGCGYNHNSPFHNVCKVVEKLAELTIHLQSTHPVTILIYNYVLILLCSSISKVMYLCYVRRIGLKRKLHILYKIDDSIIIRQFLILQHILTFD